VTVAYFFGHHVEQPAMLPGGSAESS